MWWKKGVKAGVMLYALLMVAVFSLLLQFYLNRQVATARSHKAGEQALIAYSMAHLTKEKVESGLKEAEEKKAKEEQEGKDKASEQEVQVPPSSTDGAEESTDTEEVSTPSTSQAEQETASPSPETQPGQPEETEGQAPSANPQTEEKQEEQVAGEGQITYNHGQTAYQLEENLLTVEVQLTTGKNFHYSFHIDSEKP